MLFELSTDRLDIRDIRVTDHAFVLELLNDPAFIQNIGDRMIRNEDQAKSYISSQLIASYMQYGFGMYLVQLKSGEAIGMCGILKRDDLEYPDIGFAFLNNYRSKGYAYESAKEIRDHFVGKLDLENLFAICKQENMPSRTLLQRLGMSFQRMISYKGDDTTCLYSLKPLNKGL